MLSKKNTLYLLLVLAAVTSAMAVNSDFKLNKGTCNQIMMNKGPIDTFEMGLYALAVEDDLTPEKVDWITMCLNHHKLSEDKAFQYELGASIGDAIRRKNNMG